MLFTCLNVISDILHTVNTMLINRFNDLINTIPVYLLDIMLINAVIGLVTVVWAELWMFYSVQPGC